MGRRAASITEQMLERVTSDEIRKRREDRKLERESDHAIQFEMIQLTRSPSLLFTRKRSTNFEIQNKKHKKSKSKDKKRKNRKSNNVIKKTFGKFLGKSNDKTND